MKGEAFLMTANITIRKMIDNDYGLMAKWLSTKEILEFYRDIHSPFTLEQVKDKYEPRVRGETSVIPFIVELDGSPIGYMQQYQLEEDEQKDYGYLSNQVIYGIDQFIGIPNLFNKGYGTIMVTKFLELISQHTDADGIIVDPEVTNVRAMRCYEKCGFSKVKKINSDSSWLMEFKVNKN